MIGGCGCRGVWFMMYSRVAPDSTVPPPPAYPPILFKMHSALYSFAESLLVQEKSFKSASVVFWISWFYTLLRKLIEKLVLG